VSLPVIAYRTYRRESPIHIAIVLLERVAPP
jgi:hypothetical protein